MTTSHRIERDNGCQVCQDWLDSYVNWNPEHKEIAKLDLEFHVIKQASLLGNSVEEVYASNIFDKDIAHFVGCSLEDDDIISYTRNDFLEFLTFKKEKGTIFTNQLKAWKAYRLFYVLARREHPMMHLDTEIAEEEASMSWEEELLEILYEKANTKEMLGNYSYRTDDTLPAQQ